MKKPNKSSKVKTTNLFGKSAPKKIAPHQNPMHKGMSKMPKSMAEMGH